MPWPVPGERPQGLGAEDRQGLLPGLETEVETPVTQRSRLDNLGGERERRSQSKWWKKLAVPGGLGEVKPGLPSLPRCPSPPLQPKEAVPALPTLDLDLLFCEMGLTGLMPEPASESPGKVLKMHSPRLHP